MSDDRVMRALRLSRSRWGRPLLSTTTSRAAAYFIMALYLGLLYVVGLVLFAVFIIGLVTGGGSGLLGLFVVLWLLTTAFGWTVVRRSYVMGLRVLSDGALLVGALKERHVSWDAISRVALRQAQFAKISYAVPVIETVDGPFAVWDGRLRTLRVAAARTLREAIASEVAQHRV